MRNDMLLGLIGAIFGMSAALYIILSADSHAMELSGVQVALFSALGLGGAGIAKKKSSFAGWMMIGSAVFLCITAPLSGSVAVPLSYVPAIIFFGTAWFLALRESTQDIRDRDSGRSGKSE